MNFATRARVWAPCCLRRRFKYSQGFENYGLEEMELRKYEGCRFPVAGPASYVDAVEGLVKKGTKVVEGGERKGVCRIEMEMNLGNCFQAEVKGLCFEP